MDKNLSEFQDVIILRNNRKSLPEISRELRKKYSKTVTKREMQYMCKKWVETGSVLDKM